MTITILIEESTNITMNAKNMEKQIMNMELEVKLGQLLNICV
jgi:hypothetical protein